MPDPSYEKGNTVNTTPELELELDLGALQMLDGEEAHLLIGHCTDSCSRSCGVTCTYTS